MKTSFSLYASVTVVAAIGVTILALVANDLRRPYTTDGATYVEVARNLVKGKGLMHTPWGLEPYEVDAITLRTFAPGYPMIIAGVSVLGVDPKPAALGISIVFWVLLAPAIVFCMRPLIGDVPAFIVALLVCLSPGHFASGTRIYADTSFFFFVAISLGLLIRGIRAELQWKIIVLSGAVASLAYTIRFSGISLVAAVLAAFGAAVVFRVFSIKEALRGALYWLVGFIPLFAMILLFAPERMDPGVRETPGMLLSVRLYLWNLLLDLSGSKLVATAAWDYRATLFLLIPIGAITSIGILIAWRNESERSQRFGILLMLSYLMAGASMVILAIYLWDVVGILRYVTKQSWIVFALVALAALTLKRMYPKTERTWRW